MELWYEDSKANKIRYKLRVDSAAMGESKEKGTPQVELGIAVVGFYQSGQLAPLEGPPRSIFLSLTDDTLGTATQPGWVALTLRDLGFVGPSFSDECLQVMVGQIRDGTCKHEQNPANGEWQEKWGIFRQGRTPQRPAEAKTVRTLDGKHKDLLKSFAKTATSTPPAATSVPPAAQPPAPRPAPGRPAPTGKKAPLPPGKQPATSAETPQHQDIHVDPETGQEIPF